MRRVLAPVLCLALLGAIGSRFLVEESHAELESGVFTSSANQLRMVIPRGWRATDQPSYPGLLLWMLRSQPPGQIVLTAEPFTREQYCSWPIACRASNESTAAKYACALRSKLAGQRLTVGPVQAGPKDTAAAGLPSVWFEYDDNKRFLRQAVAIGDDRVVTLVLSAPSNDARAQHVRPFEQALRTLRRLSSAEAAPVVDAAPSDAGVTSDAPSQDAGFSSAPSPAPLAPVAPLSPIGPCTTDR